MKKNVLVKVVCGIAAAVLVIVGTVIFFLEKNDKDNYEIIGEIIEDEDDYESAAYISKKATDEAEQIDNKELATVSDGVAKDKETDAGDESTEVVEVTEQPIDTVAPVSSEVYNYETYQDAYLAILNVYKDEIEFYNQHISAEYKIDDDNDNEKGFGAISLTDVTGDEIPELIILHSENKDSSYGILSVFSYKDKTAKLIYNENWDVLFAGGTNYFLFKKENDNTLYACSMLHVQNVESGYYEFKVGENGTLEKRPLITNVATETEKGIIEYKYTVEGRPVTEDEYKSSENQMISSANTLLIYNYLTDLTEEQQRHFLYEITPGYLTINGAKALLQNK